jgi:KaiC/GvpD/RAD55 family RecA-like ATPase
MNSRSIAIAQPGLRGTANGAWEEQRMRVKTNLAEAYWVLGDDFKPASSRTRSKGDQKAEPIAWLDRLLGNGLEVPDNSGRALTLLLTGPPGAGKSTFAFELCHRARLIDDNAGPRTPPREPRSIYLTTESNLALMKHQKDSFHWFDAKVGPSEEGTPVNIVVKEMKDLGEANWIKNVVSVFKGVKGFEPPLEAVNKIVDANVRKKIKRTLSADKPEIVVIDSLNVAPTRDRGNLFKAYQSLINEEGPRLLVLVLDTSDNPSGHEFWGYVADVIIRLDYKWIEGYMVRTLEIQKARYQLHAWRSHQLKVYGPQETARDPEERRLQHPFRNEGGIFVFPSIHYYLSQYKRSQPVELGHVNTPFDALDDLLGGKGFLTGRCVALIGDRGGHKSHLGYLHVLKQLDKNERARALIISLRDDERVAYHTMEQIWRDQLERSDLIPDRLELMYFPPGYITPEEFFHRVYINIQRLRFADSKNEYPITVLFNSLDQLNARFPLCAREHIFVPGLIEMFCAEGITSIFIGVQDRRQPHEQYGLVTMADIIISAQREPVELYMPVDQEEPTPADGDTSVSAQPRPPGLRKRTAPQAPAPSGHVVVLRVERVAGGRPAGQYGILELVEEEVPGSAEKKRLLTFTSAKALATRSDALPNPPPH